MHMGQSNVTLYPLECIPKHMGQSNVTLYL